MKMGLVNGGEWTDCSSLYSSLHTTHVGLRDKKKRQIGDRQDVCSFGRAIGCSSMLPIQLIFFML